MPTTLLYYLSDGEDGEVRYVGKTSKTLKHRLSQHLRDAASRREQRSYRIHWIRSAKAVQIHLVAEVEGNGSAQEIELIASLRKLGALLVNGTDGGEGAPGRRQSEEAKLRIGAANRGSKGFRHSAESRALMSATLVAARGTPEARAAQSVRSKKQAALRARAVVDVTSGAVYANCTRAAEALGVTPSMIGHAVNGGVRTAKGHVLRYADSPVAPPSRRSRAKRQVDST